MAHNKQKLLVTIRNSLIELNDDEARIARILVRSAGGPELYTSQRLSILIHGSPACLSQVAKAFERFRSRLRPVDLYYAPRRGWRLISYKTIKIHLDTLDSPPDQA